MSNDKNEYEKVGPLELTDELYDELVAEHKKIAVFDVDGDKYVFRYFRPIEWKALQQMLNREKNVDKAVEISKREVLSLLVWPEREILTDRYEVDGGLEDLLATRFLNFYQSRGAVEAQKKS